MKEGHKEHIQQQKTRRVVDRAVGGQLVLLRRPRRSVLLVTVVLAHLHQTFVVDRVLVNIAGVVHGTSQLGGVESRNGERKHRGICSLYRYAPFRVWPGSMGECKGEIIQTAVVRARRGFPRPPLVDTQNKRPTSGVRTVHTEVLLCHVLLHIHCFHRSRVISQTLQIGTIELDYASVRAYE